MVKSNKKDKNCLNFISSVYSFNQFEGKLSLKSLLIYNLIFLVLLFIISYFKELTLSYGVMFSEILIYVVLGVPLLLFIFHGLLYIIVNSFESKRKPFFESFLVFVSISVPFVIMGNLLVWINLLVFNLTLVAMLDVLVSMLYIYFIMNFVLNFTNYSKTSIFRMITSLILVFVFLGLIFVSQYLMELVSASM